MSRLTTLLDGLTEDTLSDAEMADLSQLLKDAGPRAELARRLHTDQVIATYFSERAAAKETHRVPTATSGIWYRHISAAAATLLAVVGVYFLLAHINRDGVIGQITEVSGETTMTTRHGTFRPTAGTRVTSDANLATLDGRSTVAMVLADRSSMRLSAATQARVSDTPNGTRVFVSHGRLTADITRQLEGRPMVFVTPSAEATVLGTKLSLTVERDSTRLEVVEGRVRLTGVADRSLFADVQAGQYAVATSNGVAPPARTLPSVATSLFRYGSATNGGMVLPYRYYVPTNYYADTARHYPMIVYLHGIGACGTDNEAQLEGGRAAVLQLLSPANQTDQPCFLVAPQCPTTIGWFYGAPHPCMKALVDQMIAAYPIDTNRLYITGLGLGGAGAWQHAGRDPRFATVVPVCGSKHTNDSAIATFAARSVWAFHGALDLTATPVSGTREMVDRIRRAGGAVIYTEYPALGHDIGRTAYGTPGLYSWIMSQELGRPSQGVPCVRITAVSPLKNSVRLSGTAVALPGFPITSTVWNVGAGLAGPTAGTTNWTADVTVRGDTDCIVIVARDSGNTTFNAVYRRR